MNLDKCFKRRSWYEASGKFRNRGTI